MFLTQKMSLRKAKRQNEYKLRSRLTNSFLYSNSNKKAFNTFF